MFSGKEIRDKYLKFFESKGHKVYESASLIPDDPTMLLTIAGMVPFKPFFLGKKEPVYKRATSSQKCIRTNDIENVGRTARHHTFFEMLGNFTFGDYFKEEAILWAWEFVTEELKLDKEKLYITVFEDDDESIKLWNEKAGVPLDRISKLGKKSNFWESGPTGPCGPCSEIHVDLGEAMGCNKPDCTVGCDCDRYLEIWNLVFMEYNRLENGDLQPLPKKNIDTGMGLERITSVLQKVRSNFETDLLRPIMDEAAKVAGKTYGQNAAEDFSLRVITDHLRSFTMLINDGVLPSNDGRGYILRRILRRAARHGRILGITKPFLYILVDKVIEVMGDPYKELIENRDHLKKVILTEEEKFERTLDQGIAIANDEIKKLKAEGKSKIDSSIAFKLYDTFGFPFELTEEICQENSIEINFEEFKQKMEEQKEKARNSREVVKEKIEDSFIEEFFKTNGKTKFGGYDFLESEGKVLYLKETGNDTLEVIFDSTVFYGESGGQVADKGTVSSKTFKGRVTDVQKKKDIFIHNVKIEEGTLSVGETLIQKVESQNRKNIMRNHTATHLLQSALIEVVGNHVHQAGSLVTAERLRFDFSHYTAVTKEELESIERIVNEKILEAVEVESYVKTMDEAKQMGATALFGDKYGDIVRIVKVSDFSTELCGGTHAENTGNIGLFKIVSETGIAAGVRRIEAVTGMNALAYLNSFENKLDNLSDTLKSDRDGLEEKAAKTMEELRLAQKELERLNSKLATLEIESIISAPLNIKGVNVIIKDFADKDVNTLREMVDKAKDKLKSCVVVFGTNNGNAVFLAGVTKDLIDKGIKAGDIIKEVSKIAGGAGGGRPDFAQAGGKEGAKVKEALDFAVKLLGEKL